MSGTIQSAHFGLYDEPPFGFMSTGHSLSQARPALSDELYGLASWRVFGELAGGLGIAPRAVLGLHLRQTALELPILCRACRADTH